MIVFLRLGQITTGLLIIALLLLNSCMTFRTSDKKVVRYFEERQTEVVINRIPYRDHQLRYLKTGRDDAGYLLVFIHGAPGSSNNFHKYLADSTLLASAQMISVDRPGYGYSDYGRSETDLREQARAVRQIVEHYPQEKVILIGHSYGGPIIGKYAMEWPERLRGIVMLAPVNDPDNEPMFWFAHFGRWKLTRWMLPGSLKVSADEKFSHAAELKKIAGDWARISVPVVHLHGYKDKLAPPVNIDFSKRNIPPPYLRMVEMNTNHFIPWSDYEAVKRELLALMK